MISKWFEYKDQAVLLRKEGSSIRDIENLTGVPRSTLSGWFKDIKLTKKQQLTLNKEWIKGLKKARVKAVKWHNDEKEKRKILAENQATKVLEKIDHSNKHILELALSMLYLGDGAKTQPASLANSNPLIVDFYIRSLEVLYNISRKELKFELHLRSDQEINEKIKYWSQHINAPIKNFSTTKDKRVEKSKSYPSYNGVCVIRGGGTHLRRRLVFLSKSFCSKILE